jgi:hypothetical protein
MHRLSRKFHLRLCEYIPRNQKGRQAALQGSGRPKCKREGMAEDRFGSRLCENSDVELSRRTFISIALNKKRTALAGTVERRKERKQFCAFSARARFYTAWVINGFRLAAAPCPLYS